MKAKITLTHEVTLFVEAPSENVLRNWMATTSPNGAVNYLREKGKYAEENYQEIIECFVAEDSNVDISIDKKGHVVQ
ncbi:MAG: hypothetical protein Q4B26_16945 [Eubacteriales bacterium]|nr:hypothetical protein [Eubacteriales bacterium]